MASTAVPISLTGCKYLIAVLVFSSLDCWAASMSSKASPMTAK